MIDYSPFWKTIKKANESTYSLIKNYNISSSTINRLRKNYPISTTTIDDLCKIFNCDVSEILRYVPEENNDMQ